MSYKLVSKKIVIPFNDIETTKIYVQAIEEVYKNEIYKISSKLKFNASSQIENNDYTIFVYSNELSLYNLTDKIFDVISENNTKLKRKLQHRELKRLINWLARGDFYGEFSDPCEVLIGKESFIETISTIFIDIFGDLKDYNLSVVFLDYEEINKSGKKKEGNILPVVELKRKISSWTSVSSNKQKHKKINNPKFTDKTFKAISYSEKVLVPKKNELEKFPEIQGDILIKAEDKIYIEIPEISIPNNDLQLELNNSTGFTPIIERINTIIPESEELNKFLKTKAIEKKINEKILNAFLINGIDINQNKLLIAINDATRMIALDLE